MQFDQAYLMATQMMLEANLSIPASTELDSNPDQPDDEVEGQEGVAGGDDAPLVGGLTVADAGPSGNRKCRLCGGIKWTSKYWAPNNVRIERQFCGLDHYRKYRLMKDSNASLRLEDAVRTIDRELIKDLHPSRRAYLTKKRELYAAAFVRRQAIESAAQAKKAARKAVAR